MNSTQCYGSGVNTVVSAGMGCWTELPVTAHLMMRHYGFDPGHSSGDISAWELASKDYWPQRVEGRCVERRWRVSFGRFFLPRIDRVVHLTADPISFGSNVTLAADGVVVKLDNAPFVYCDFGATMESHRGTFEVTWSSGGVLEVSI